MKPQARREELYKLLGRLPSRTREISVQKIWEEEREDYVLEKLILDLTGIEKVPITLPPLKLTN